MAMGKVLPFCTTGEPISPFSAHVITGPAGGWVTVIDLGEGATLSKWFPDEIDARQYPTELLEWLNQRRGAL